MDVTALQNEALPASGLRLMLEASTWPGVLGQSDFAVSPRGAGANMSVDVAGGLLVVDGGARGFYVVSSDGAVNVPIAAPPGTGESRIDAVVVQVSDSQYAGSDDEAEAVAITGEADTVPVAPSVPTGAELLGYVLVEDDTTSIGSGAITDKRRPCRQLTKWSGNPARGSEGQMVFEDSDELRVFSGGDWSPFEPFVKLSAFRYGARALPSKSGPFAADSVWDEELVVPGGTPAQAVKVDVQVSVFGGESDISTPFAFELSDGGAWHRSPVMPGAYYRWYSHVFDTPTDSIKVRIVMTEEQVGSGVIAPSGAVLSAAVSPITA